MNASHALPYTTLKTGASGMCLSVCLTCFLIPLFFSYRFVSFEDPKLLFLLLSLCLITGLRLWRGDSLLSGIRCFLPFWTAWIAAFFTSLFKAEIFSFFLISAMYYLLVLLWCTSVWPVFASPVGRRCLMRAWRASGIAVALLGLVQYWDYCPWLFPSFPTYTQPIYSVFGNQDLLGGFLAVTLCISLDTFFISWNTCDSIRRRKYRVCIGLGVECFLVGAVLLLSQCRSAWLSLGAGLFCALFFSKAVQRPQARGMVLAIPERQKNSFFMTAFQILATKTYSSQKRAVFVFFCLFVTSLLFWEAGRERLWTVFSDADVGVRARLWFWEGGLRMFWDSPWLGKGLGNFQYHSPRFLAEVLQGAHGTWHFHNSLHTVHAHCEPLEWLAETGGIGFLFLIWMGVCCLRYGGVGGGALFVFVIFSFFNASWHSAPHLLLGLSLYGMAFFEDLDKEAPQAAKNRTTRGYVKNIGLKSSFVCLSLFLAVFFIKGLLLPSYALRQAQDAHLAGEEQAVSLYEQAISYRIHPPQAHESYGMLLLDLGRPAEAQVQLQLALRALDTPRLHLMLGYAAQDLGQLEEARACYRRVLERSPTDPAAWSSLLALRTATQAPFLEAHAARWGLSTHISGTP